MAGSAWSMLDGKCRDAGRTDAVNRGLDWRGRRPYVDAACAMAWRTLPRDDFRAAQPGLAHAGLQHDERNRHAIAGGLQSLAAARSRSVRAALSRMLTAALDQLFVLQVDVDHQVAVHVAEARHGAGGDHVAGSSSAPCRPSCGWIRRPLRGRLRRRSRCRRRCPAASRGLQVTAMVLAPLLRAYSMAAMVKGVRPLAAMPTTTSFCTGLLLGDLALAEFGGILVGFDGGATGLRRRPAITNCTVFGIGVEGGRALGGVEGGDAAAGAGADIDQASAFGEGVRRRRRWPARSAAARAPPRRQPWRLPS